MVFLQIVDDRKIKNVTREKCMESVKRFVTEEDSYIVKEIRYNQDCPTMIIDADKIRFSYAQEYNDLFYVDTDCFLCALPSEENINSGKIIIGEVISDSGPVIDSFLFYVNGNKEFFLQNYKVLTEQRVLSCFSPKQLMVFDNMTVPYEPMSYSYYSLSDLEMKINQQFNILSNRLIEAEKEINSYRNAIQGMVSTTELYDKLRKK